MSDGLQENLSSYQFSRKERTLAASSSTGSPPSPGESLRHYNSNTSDGRRPQLNVRPHSSGETGRQRIKIQTIEEKINSRQAQPVNQERSRSTEPDQGPASQILVGSPSSDKNSAARKYELADPPHPPSESPNDSLERRHGKQKVARPLWTRTRSGGVWYLRQRDTSSHDGSSVRSTKSTHPLTDDIEPVGIKIIPLKPPVRPQVLQTTPTNHIVVETPFGHHHDAQVTTMTVSTIARSAGRRGSSIDVKRLFSAPLTILRRSRTEKSKDPSPSPSQTLSSTHLINVTTQSSLTGSDGTAANLRRVSSLLENHLRPTFMGRLRSCSHLTMSSNSSDNDDPRQSRTKALIGAFRVPGNHSLEHIAEYESSIFNMRMGSTPRNSPTEKATYRVKRRPSAATEEFVKIDISIRGGTSYLPSEARRISTPPLPGDNQPGGRRGFFFDYNAPHLSETCDEGHLSPQSTHFEGYSHNNYHSNVTHDVSRSASTSPQRSPSRKAQTKAMGGDWYDAQLADLDAMTGEVDVTNTAEMERYHQCKHERQARLAEIRRRRYEAQLDFDIPEHLPNSPLCPRNPRYWRVKQQKGSQFRGCWMHGFGEYDIVPGLHK